MNEFWILKIAQTNLLILFFIIIHTLSIYFSWKKAFFISLLVLLFFQYKTTDFQSPNLLDNDEQRIQQVRLREYNPSNHYLRVIFYRLDLRNFLEGEVSVVLKRLQRNFFETLDLNVYFFGGHPRQRVWANDFEKLPFFLVIPFLIGLYDSILNKKKLVFVSIILGISLLTFIGHKNNLGSFILLPGILMFVYSGILHVFKIRK